YIQRIFHAAALSLRAPGSGRGPSSFFRGLSFQSDQGGARFSRPSTGGTRRLREDRPWECRKAAEALSGAEAAGIGAAGPRYSHPILMGSRNNFVHARTTGGV